MSASRTTIWRRLDEPGHAACRLQQTQAGWTLHGTAVFLSGDGPASLTYHVNCDSTWQTTEGRVHGWNGSRTVDLRAVRTPQGHWTLQGRPTPDAGTWPDLDLGFTPATNLLSLRRMALRIGERRECAVAWLDVQSPDTLQTLHQVYERLDANRYRYESPRFDYAATLIVDDAGFVRMYPGLWEAQT